MTSEGLGEMFKGDAADTCGRKFLLVSMENSIKKMFFFVLKASLIAYTSHNLKTNI